MKTFQMFSHHYVPIYWHQHVYFTKLSGITRHVVAVQWVPDLFLLKPVAATVVGRVTARRWSEGLASSFAHRNCGVTFLLSWQVPSDILFTYMHSNMLTEKQTQTSKTQRSENALYKMHIYQLLNEQCNIFCRYKIWISAKLSDLLRLEQEPELHSLILSIKSAQTNPKLEIYLLSVNTRNWVRMRNCL